MANFLQRRVRRPRRSAAAGQRLRGNSGDVLPQACLTKTREEARTPRVLPCLGLASTGRARPSGVPWKRVQCFCIWKFPPNQAPEFSRPVFPGPAVTPPHGHSSGEQGGRALSVQMVRGPASPSWGRDPRSGAGRGERGRGPLGSGPRLSAGNSAAGRSWGGSAPCCPLRSLRRDNGRGPPGKRVSQDVDRGGARNRF